MRKNDNTTAYRENLKDRILDKAMPMFKKHGVKAVKMDDIATELQISKRTLYEIYNNKEEMFFECVKRHKESSYKKITEFAKNAENEMEIIAYFLKVELDGIDSINPLFFSEMHKYQRVVDFLRAKDENKHEKSILFIKSGIEHGFFRDDINYDILHCMEDAIITHVMKTKMYEKFSMKDIFHTLVLIHMRGCCTEKGLKYLDNLLKNDNENKHIHI